MARLTVGDYLINDEVLIERKTLADFAASLVDGRLFPQAARLARDDHRSLMLIEGPAATSMPDVHPHAIQGALVSLAAMWRLPVLHAFDPDGEIRRLQIDGRASGREAIAYRSAVPFAEVCIDAASVAHQAPSSWLCFASNVPPPPTGARAVEVAEVSR